jgi:hypothetical protein
LWVKKNLNLYAISFHARSDSVAVKIRKNFLIKKYKLTLIYSFYIFLPPAKSAPPGMVKKGARTAPVIMFACSGYVLLFNRHEAGINVILMLTFMTEQPPDTHETMLHNRYND